MISTGPARCYRAGLLGRTEICQVYPWDSDNDGKFSRSLLQRGESASIHDKSKSFPTQKFSSDNFYRPCSLKFNSQVQIQLPYLGYHWGASRRKDRTEFELLDHPLPSGSIPNSSHHQARKVKWITVEENETIAVMHGKNMMELLSNIILLYLIPRGCRRIHFFGWTLLNPQSDSGSGHGGFDLTALTASLISRNWIPRTSSSLTMKRTAAASTLWTIFVLIPL